MKSFLSLEKINLFCENFIVYEPELFPCLILRNRKATLLIFGSGKVVITGLKDYNLIQLIFNDVFNILKSLKNNKNLPKTTGLFKDQSKTNVKN